MINGVYVDHDQATLRPTAPRNTREGATYGRQQSAHEDTGVQRHSSFNYIYSSYRFTVKKPKQTKHKKANNDARYEQNSVTHGRRQRSKLLVRIAEVTHQEQRARHKAFLCVAAPSAIRSKISMKEAAYLIIGTKTAFVWSENFRKWQALTPDRQIT